MCIRDRSLAYGENKQNKNPYGYYHCSKNGQGLRQCSMHYIRYDVLYAYVPVSYTHLDVYKRQTNSCEFFYQLVSRSRLINITYGASFKCLLSINRHIIRGCLLYTS